MKEGFKEIPNLTEESPGEILTSDSPIWIEFDYPELLNVIVQGDLQDRYCLMQSNLDINSDLEENTIHGYGDLFLEGFDYNPETHTVSLFVGS